MRIVLAALLLCGALLSLACRSGDTELASGAGRTGTPAWPSVTIPAPASPTLTPVPPTPTEAPPEPTATAEPPPPPPTAVPPTAVPQAQPASQAPPPAPPPPAPSAPPAPVTFNVTARVLQFSTSSLTARSGASVTVNFRNEDAQIAHDITFSIAGLGHGHTCFGPCSDSYTFTAPAPGNYPFFCTVHMDMQGNLIVTP